MSKSFAEKCLLAKLEEYGDSLLEEKQPVKKRKKAIGIKHASGVPITNGTDKDASEVQSMSKNRRKKAKMAHRKQVEHEHDESEKPSENVDFHGAEKHLEDMKVKLGLTDEDFRFKAADSKTKKSGAVKTLARGRQRDVEVVVFMDPAKRKQTIQEKPPAGLEETEVEESSDKQHDQPEFDLSSARLEVRKCGINSMRKKLKKRATVDLLMKLGAAAPRKEYVNYRVYQQDRKQQIEEERVKREEDRSMGFKVKKVNKKKRDKNDIVGRIDGQVGKYRYGVQYVDKKTIDD